MASLKTVIPDIAPWLDTTAPRLFDRAKELTRAGVFVARPGRGPGSGVEATFETVSVIVLTALMTSGASDYADHARTLVASRCLTTEFDPVTGQSSPVASLAYLLATRERLRGLESLTCHRAGRTITFDYADRTHPGIGGITYGPAEGYGTYPNIFVTAQMLRSVTLYEIAESIPGHITHGGK